MEPLVSSCQATEKQQTFRSRKIRQERLGVLEAQRVQTSKRLSIKKLGPRTIIVMVFKPQFLNDEVSGPSGKDIL